GEAELQARLGRSRQELAERTRRRDKAREDAEALRRELADLRAHASGLQSRIDVLDGLEKSHEGLSAGIHEVFESLGTPQSPLAGLVAGWVADCLSAPREYAPVLDLALGPLAHAFLVRDPAALSGYLVARPEPFPGRVGFVPLDRPAPRAPEV